MGEMIDVVRPDGDKVRTYRAMPPSGAPETHAGVVMIHEWWGLNDNIQRVADRLAAEGYEVLCPDLYHGKVAVNAIQAQKLMTMLDGKAAVEQDVRGAAQHLVREDKKAAVMGFCLGGALTITSAVHVAELSAAICFYGIPPENRADPRKVRVPLQGHFAENDDWCTPERVDELETQLEEGDVRFELHRYQGAAHAFFNEARPEAYDASASKLAWERSLEFLKRNMPPKLRKA